MCWRFLLSTRQCRVWSLHYGSSIVPWWDRRSRAAIQKHLPQLSLVYYLLFPSHQLVVHVGVSGMATTVTLEKCGRNHGYRGLDNSSFCPDSQCCIVGGPDCITSVIDMESVCKRVTSSGLGVAVSVSKDAGRYFNNLKNKRRRWLCLVGRVTVVWLPFLGISVTSPTTRPCTWAAAAPPSFTCLLSESLTAGKTWDVRCRPLSVKCWSCWTRRRRRSTASSTSTEATRRCLPVSLAFTKNKRNCT